MAEENVIMGYSASFCHLVKGEGLTIPAQAHLSPLSARPTRTTCPNHNLEKTFKLTYKYRYIHIYHNLEETFKLTNLCLYIYT